MKPTDILMEEHRNIERMLTVLETHAGRVQEGGRPDPAAFRTAIRFIREYADACHHGKEEDLLFTAMIERGFPRESGPIAVMLHEHDVGRMHVREMSAALDRFEAGEETASADLARQAFGYAQLLRSHIYKEDNMLFPMADGQLAPSDQELLLRRFEEFLESGVACATRAELLALLAELEAAPH